MKKMDIDFLDELSFLSSLKASKDQKALYFIKSMTDSEENEYRSYLYRYDILQKKLRKMTTTGKENLYTILDDDSLLFANDRAAKKNKDQTKKETSFYRLLPDGGEAERYFTIPRTVTDIHPIDEDRFLILFLYDPNAPSEEDPKDAKDYIIYDEIPFHFNGEGIINKKRTRLGIYHRSKDVLEEITDKWTNILKVVVHSDRKRALIISSSYETKLEMKDTLSELSLDNHKIKLLSDLEYSISDCGYLGEDVFFAGSKDQPFGLNQNARLYRIHPDQMPEEMIDPSVDLGYGTSVGTDIRMSSGRDSICHEEILYFKTTDEYATSLYRMEPDGSLDCLLDKPGAIDDFIVIHDTIYFFGVIGSVPQELYAYSNTYERLTHGNDLGNYRLSTIETLRFQNEEHEFTGFVLKPAFFDKNKKYPGILTVHGGPKTVYGPIIHHEMQLLAAQGYFVFFTNPRGSDGRGNEFSDIRGQYGSIDFEDLMAFTDVVVEQYPQIDPKRLAIMGGSYGGFMTNWAIGHTDRFKAAISQRSISNWTSFFGTSDIGYFFSPDQTASDNWNNVEKAWEQSPLRTADQVTTPTLFIHADEDFRCPLEQGQQMYTALQYYGVPTKMVVFKGENHDLSRTGKPLHRKRRLQEIIDWFEKHL